MIFQTLKILAKQRVMRILFKECSKHGHIGNPDCNECMRNLLEFASEKNMLVISEDGDPLNE